ncbi:MAG TPA: hypothetical protein DDX92_10610 [Flavobacteriales bacterium]|jgi:hypothetical protein|nr:hypothetical protein [Flavobacteriales bacterium]
MLAFFVISCDGFFGEKTDVDFIDIPDFQARPVAYVPILPILDQFLAPTDIHAGFDELIYVVDEAAESIIALDQSGRELYSFRVPGVTAVIQDRRLNLIAIGTKDTTIAGTDYELACLYRIDLQGDLGYGLNNARIVNEIVHPFYFKSSFSRSDGDVRFTDAAVIDVNEFYVSRTGPNNDPAKFGGPDDAVLLFNANDTYITPISVTTQGGVFKDFFKMPFGLTSRAQPPQISASFSRDFFYTSIDADPDNLYRVRQIEYRETDFGLEYVPNPIGQIDTSKAFGFISEPNKFLKPVDITLAGDGTGFIFVIDEAKDSLYQFTSNGLEGVQPPPGSGEVKHIKVSFGGTGIEPNQFNNPVAVAYLNEIVYVADKGNGRVLRFKLTTNFD